MKAALLGLAILIVASVSVIAEEICGNPCEEGYVWTDKDMGKCIPAPEKPTS